MKNILSALLLIAVILAPDFALLLTLFSPIIPANIASLVFVVYDDDVENDDDDDDAVDNGVDNVVDNVVDTVDKVGKVDLMP